jgi:anti-anti-sigma regulatory factor
VWRRLHGEAVSGHRVEVELRAESTVWITVRGSLSATGAGKLASDLCAGLRRRKERLVIDLERLAAMETAALEVLIEPLRAFQDRVRVLLPARNDPAAMPFR